MEKRAFGTNLRKLREQAGLSQRSLAATVGVDVSYLSKIENCVMPPPSQELIIRLADALNTDKDELLTLAGRVPADIAQMLKNRDVLQSLRDGHIVTRVGYGSKNKDVINNFNKKLKELREKAGLSQSELAMRVGVSFTYLSKIENGVKPPPSEKVILKLAEALKCDKDDLMSSAGKVPSDVAGILKSREIRQSLRESQARRTQMSASGRGNGINIMKYLMNGKGLVKVGVALVLVAAVAASLILASPLGVKALTIDITNPGGAPLQPATIAQSYNFQTKITVGSSELLPVDSIDLSIYSATNPSGFRAVLAGLPLTDSGSASYSNLQTGGGVANVTSAITNAVLKHGTGNVTYNSINYPFPVGYGFANATITYNVAWTSPAGWPIGNYLISANITKGATILTQTSGFTLSTPLMAETSISQGLSSNVTGVIVANTVINRIKNPADNVTAILLGGIGSYGATVSSNVSSAIQIVAVYGVPPFNGPSFNASAGTFGVANVTSPLQPNNNKVAQLVTVLTGNTTTSVGLTIGYLGIGAAGQPGLNAPEQNSNTLKLLRGDADNNGKVEVTDSLAVKQYLVGQLTLSQINAINAAGPAHDGVNGDQITVTDALAIEQMLVHQLDSYYH